MCASFVALVLCRFVDQLTRKKNMKKRVLTENVARSSYAGGDNDDNNYLNNNKSWSHSLR
jgi:hypothetical protein